MITHVLKIYRRSTGECLASLYGLPSVPRIGETLRLPKDVFGPVIDVQWRFDTVSSDLVYVDVILGDET